MHRYGALATDLVGVALTPFVALLIRDNFVFYAPHWQAIVGYATISFAMLSVALVIAGSHKVVVAIYIASRRFEDHIDLDRSARPCRCD